MEHKNFKFEKKISPPDVSIIETPLTALPMQQNELAKAPIRKQTAAKRMEAIAAGLKNKRRNSSIYGRRLSRRVEEICTPTSGDTTSSAAFSNTPKDNNKLSRRQTVSSVTTTSGGFVDKTTSRQKRIHKKAQKEKGARPSLNLQGNIFFKYRTSNKGVQHDLNKRKSRKQRNDHFNQGRNLKILKGKAEATTEEEDEETMIRNLTYDIKNNNYAAYNRNVNMLGQTIVLKKGESVDLKKEEIELFTNGSEIFESQLETDEWSPYFEDYGEDYHQYESEEYEHHCDDTDDDGYVAQEIAEDNESIKTDIKYAIPMKKEMTCKEELVTSFDLEEFDRYVSKTNKKEEHYDAYSSNGSSQHFEKLLRETESSAPFNIKHIHYGHSQHEHSEHNNSSSHFETFASSSELHNPHNVSMPTPHLSPNNTAGHLSRTIYGGTVIYNRRIPNINTTYVRKSSIYIKNNNDSTSAFNDVVLITNQTITLVDLARMWRQMDSSTRLIISFAALASVTTLLGLFLSFCSKR